MITAQQSRPQHSTGTQLLERIDSVLTTSLPTAIRETKEHIHQLAGVATAAVAEASLASLTGPALPALLFAREVAGDLAFEAISSQVDGATNPWSNLSSTMTIEQPGVTTLRDLVKREIHNQVEATGINEASALQKSTAEIDDPKIAPSLASKTSESETKPSLLDASFGSESKKHAQQALMEQGNRSRLRERALLPPRLTLY